MWVSKWFLTLFSYSFKYEDVLRIWDFLVVKGIAFAVNISISMVVEFEKVIMNKDFVDVMTFFSELKEP